MALLVGAAFVAAFVDSIVGGGGAITLPALLAAGLPAHQALGTNKFVATGASGMATVQYVRAGIVQGRVAWFLVPFTLVGSVVGAWVVLGLAGHFIRWAVLGVMGAMLVYVVVRPRFGNRDEFRVWGGVQRTSTAVMALALGFYDGVLGPGTGSMLIFAFVALLGMGFLGAAAHGRVLNFVSNASALVVFAWVGEVDYGVGLPMLGATLVGGFVGSRFGIRHGVKWIRPLFVVVTAGLMVRLLLF